MLLFLHFFLVALSPFSVYHSLLVQVHSRALEFPRMDTFLKKHIQLRIRSSLRLRKSEKHPNNNTSASSSPEECCLGTPIPGVIKVIELVVLLPSI